MHLPHGRSLVYLGVLLTSFILLLSGPTSLAARGNNRVTVSINPTSVTLTSSAAQQFAATVTGSSNTSLTWSATGGTISTSGLYTAPTSAGTYAVTATSVADTTKSASATITVTAPVAVSVSISPSSASLTTGGTQQFSATVNGSSNTAVNWSATGGTISTSGLYTAPTTAGTYTVTARSVADSTKSASATVTVTTGCVLGTTSWVATPLGISETGTFGVSFDVTPQGNVVDADVALSQNQPAAYADLAAIVRFNPSGYIDVRNGSAYAAAYSQPYTANTTYHFSVVVNVAAHLYSVYVTAPGGTQQLLANDYAFRAEQASASSLNYWIPYQDPSSSSLLQVCNFAVNAVTLSVSPKLASLPPSGTQQFSATVTGTTNTAVTWSATGGTVSTSGLYTAPVTAGTYTVTATSVADPTQSASATVTVAAPGTGTVSISISPTSTSLTTGGTQQFTTTVTGSTNTSVTWSGTAGTITTSGLYTAPTSAGTYTVTATSVADTTKSASATITVTAAALTQVLNVSPTGIAFGNVLTTNTASQNVTLSNTGSGSVTVSAANFSGGVFSATGLTLPATIAAGATKAVTIKFAPAISGPFSGSVSFVSNATNSPATVSLTGTGVAPQPHSVDLSWVGSTSSGVIGYYVYRSTVSGSGYAKLNAGSVAPTTTYTDSSVQSGVTYYYVVTAVDGSGNESTYSNQSVATIPLP
jgi:hypothetical protein